MALFNCPECNTTISDKATICPHCGFAVAEYIRKLSSECERTDKLYLAAIEQFNSNNPQSVAQAKTTFATILDWKAAEEYYEKCDERIKELEPVYKEGKRKRNRIRLFIRMCEIENRLKAA